MLPQEILAFIISETAVEVTYSDTQIPCITIIFGKFRGGGGGGRCKGGNPMAPPHSN